ncbi:AI-2E family transporter [Pseudonocardia xinjiangensis]|uniref:AI-2E family transporter n=1 Tax=Pseudonocardia xinjiangensis TaxID=75289 RepID=UPI003D8D64AE
MGVPADAPDPSPTDGRPGAAPVGAALPRGVVVLLGTAAAIVIAAGLRSVAWLIGPVFLALIIVIAVAPVQRWFRQRGWPRWAITLVLVLAVYGVVVVLALTVVVSIARLATTLPEYAEQSKALAQSATNLLARFGVSPEQLRHIVDSLDIGKLVGLLGAFLGSIAGLAGNLVFILALLLFLSIETGGAAARIRLIATDRPAVSEALGNFAHGTRQYLVVTTVFGLIVAVLDTIALALIGIPLAVTWGLLSFVTNYIPNIGFILGVVPPALLGLLVGGPQTMVLVIVLYCVLNFVVQSLIQPRFIGDAVGLSITVTFLALVFWTWLIGPLGAILAIPLTLLTKALLVDIDPRAAWADALLRSSAMNVDESPATPTTPTTPAAPRRPWTRWRLRHQRTPG